MNVMSWLVQAAKTLGLILFYYCFSIGLTFYNKRVLTVSIASCVLLVFVPMKAHSRRALLVHFAVPTATKMRVYFLVKPKSCAQ